MLAAAFQRGNESSKINVELYIDLSVRCLAAICDFCLFVVWAEPFACRLRLRFGLQCSDTQAVWGTLNKVYSSYKSSVNFLYHVFPLPYHQYAFVLSKAGHVVDAYGDDGAVFHYFDTVFANQEQILNSATADKTYDESGCPVSCCLRDWFCSSMR